MTKLKADSLDSNFSVRQQARHSGIKAGGIPVYGIFDHKGKLRAQGRVSTLDKWLADLLAEIPYIEIDVDSFKVLNDVAKLMTDQETMVKGYLKAVSAAKKKSASEEVVSEAKQIIDKADAFAEGFFERIFAKIDEDPVIGQEELEVAFKTFKNMPVVDSSKEKLREIKGSEDYKNKLKISKEFAQCKEKIEKKGPAVKQKDALTIFRRLIKYTDENPDYEISKKAKKYIKKYI